MNYGLPYKGSKDRIAKLIVDALPPAECLVDVFCGGCAITHAAMLSGKYKRIVANDIDGKVPRLFKDAISGRLPDNYDRFISRDEFKRLKDSDAIVACCWSFGNNKESYLWNENTAGAKGLAHQMIVEESKEERRRLYREFIKYLQQKRAELKEKKDKFEARKLSITDTKEKLREILRDALKKSGLTASAVDRHLRTNGMAGHYFGASQWEFPTREAYAKLREILALPVFDFFAEDLERLQSLERLERLQSLESLESLQRLERLQSLESLESLQSGACTLEVSAFSYDELKMPDSSIIYCDPPYKRTGGYNGTEFDSCTFWQWVREKSKTHLVAVSEYKAPIDFVSILSVLKNCSYSSTKNNKKTVENVFVHESRLADFKTIKAQAELELM